MAKPIVNNTPAVTIDCTAPEGNAFYILGVVAKILRNSGRSDLVSEYETKATSSDYEHLKDVSKEYINIKFCN